ncbi:hypothetical protein Dimus_007822 [Dionaea muscipula]
MESLDQGGNGKSLDDVMYQRMKNRERQRRYRERKRLQAEMMNRASVKSLPTNLPTEPSPIGASNHCITRVHCARDWKKDARRAHAVKQEVSSVITCHAFTSAGENEASFFTSGAKASEHCSNGEVPSATAPGVDTREKDHSKPGRRNWKAEARNKKL